MYNLEKIKYKSILNIESMYIPPGKITCIIGKSGSGKTTFLKLLNRMISPDTGDIYYQGKDIRLIDPVILRREVVMLPQNPVVFEGNIEDNLQKGLMFSERPLIKEEQLMALLECVQLKKALKDNVENLSGGEKQRLAIGRVLAMEPKVLLLDEPSSALDENTEETVIDTIVKEVKGTEKTLIMVTHSTKIANQFAENIIEF